MNDKVLKFLPLIPVLILLLVLTGCGGSADEANAPAVPAPEFTYISDTVCTVISTKAEATAAEPRIITDNGYYATGGVYRHGNAPEGAAAEFEGQFDTVVPCISFVSNDGTVSTLEAYEPIIPETGMENMRDYRVNNSIETLKLRSDGNLIAVEKVYVSWNEADSEVKYGSEEYYEKIGSEETWWLRVLRTDGSEVSRGALDIGGEDGVGFYTCVLDEADDLLVSRDTGLTAFNAHGKKVYDIELESGYIYSLANTADGKVAALVFDINAYKMTVRLIDSTGRKFEDKSFSLDMDAYSLTAGSGSYDLYINTGSSFFGYDLENEQSSKLFSWIDCDLTADRMTAVTVGADGSVKGIFIDYDSDMAEQTAELVEVKKVPYDAVSEKKHLRLATFYPYDMMMDSVIDFNRAHKDVRIDLIDYSEYDTDEDSSVGLTKPMTEITAGDMPDILDISPGFPYNRFAANGMLVDLYPYLEADPELSEDDFFENILKAVEVNGGLYMANAGCGIYSAVGAASVVGDEAGMTYDEYFEALSKMPEGCEGFDVGYDRESALSMSVALEFPKLVNWSTGECRFDSEDFINILNYAVKFGKFDRENYEASPEDASSVRVAEGRQMLSEVIFTSVDYMLSDYDSMFGGKATVVGFPTSEGAGHMLYLTNGLAITSKCDIPDIAWEFVRTLFTEDYQKKQDFIPTNKNIFESELAKAMEVKYLTDANGNYRLDENGERIPRSYGYYYDGTKRVDVYSITEKQAQMLRTTITDTTRLLNFDESIDDIVTEGAQAFFEGQRSAEECARLIQSKVNIYVNEQK